MDCVDCLHYRVFYSVDRGLYYNRLKDRDVITKYDYDHLSPGEKRLYASFWEYIKLKEYCFIPQKGIEYEHSSSFPKCDPYVRNVDCGLFYTNKV